MLRKRRPPIVAGRRTAARVATLTSVGVLAALATAGLANAAAPAPFTIREHLAFEAETGKRPGNWLAVSRAAARRQVAARAMTVA
jgi:hypothetical protein